MRTVTSEDGTTIAYDRSGQGPALVLVTGALAARATAASVVGKLAPHFTVFAYDRRGRGDSGDTPPYAVEREVEDLKAVIDAAGGTAFVFGHSSGAVLALEAAQRLTGSIPKLALHEPPFIMDDSRPPLPDDYLAQLNTRIAAGRPDELLDYYFTRALLLTPEAVAGMRKGPGWAGMERMAHTLAYDGAVIDGTMGGKPLPRDRWARVTMPVLVMDGGASPAFMHHGAEALTALLPHAQHRRFPGQDHGVADEVLVPALVEFFL
jgi:pimeloyl-ACP methyl ester carboxylesterase